MIYMHLNFCCVTVDAINETMAAYLNETDLFGGEWCRPLVIAPLYFNQPLAINPSVIFTNHKSLTNSKLQIALSSLSQNRRWFFRSQIFLFCSGFLTFPDFLYDPFIWSDHKDIFACWYFLLLSRLLQLIPPPTPPPHDSLLLSETVNYFSAKWKISLLNDLKVFCHRDRLRSSCWLISI